MTEHDLAWDSGQAHAAQGDIEVPWLAYQGGQQQPGHEKTYAHIEHHPWAHGGPSGGRQQD